ncbi:hypothetical protein [Mycoplasma hafezii]|uniref:hypothetical protein n=1 Tax=Mycoplasma hafezii TaxID=525886 RepID=UPI003CE89ACB
MDYKKLLNEQFDGKILEAKLVNNLGTTLEVVLNSTNLDEVEKFSRELYDYLETQSWFKDEYNLEVLSKGSDLTLDVNNLADSIGTMVKFHTVKSFEGLNTFVAELLEEEDTRILVKWNKKGQFRKVWFDKANISSIETYIKF